MPSFIAATEPLPAAQTVKPEACSSFDAFLSVKKSMRSLLCQRRKKCAFLTEEKSTKRLIEATASNSHASAGKAYTHGSQQTEPRTYVRSPSFAVRRLCATGSSAPAGAKLPTHTSDRTERSRLLFVLFFPQRKGDGTAALHTVPFYFMKRIYISRLVKASHAVHPNTTR